MEFSIHQAFKFVLALALGCLLLGSVNKLDAETEKNDRVDVLIDKTKENTKKIDLIKKSMYK